MLHIRNLSASYGHIEALRDVSIDIGKGQIVSIIGSNGAGKTTLLRCISGLIKPTSGSIEFMGKPISKSLISMWLPVLSMSPREENASLD